MFWLSLLTSTFVAIQSTQQCRSTYSVWGRYLKDHVILSENVKNIGVCYIQCSMNQRCKSINFNFGNLLCELNEADRYTHPWDYELKKDHAYSDYPVKVCVTFSVPFSSISSEFGHAVVCILLTDMAAQSTHGGTKQGWFAREVHQNKVWLGKRGQVIGHDMLAISCQWIAIAGQDNASDWLIAKIWIRWFALSVLHWLTMARRKKYSFDIFQSNFFRSFSGSALDRSKSRFVSR